MRSTRLTHLTRCGVGGCCGCGGRCERTQVVHLKTLEIAEPHVGDVRPAQWVVHERIRPELTRRVEVRVSVAGGHCGSHCGRGCSSRVVGRETVEEHHVGGGWWRLSD